MADNTRVLVVEDEPAIVELVKYSLREAGWDIGTADTVGGVWSHVLELAAGLDLATGLLGRCGCDPRRRAIDV